MYTIKEIIKSLAQPIMDFEKEFPIESLKRTDFGQSPAITLLSCADSRVPVHIFGESFNRIFSVENIGNQVKTSEGSILYGLLHLHTPVMLVVGHTDCGALKAADKDFSAEPPAIIKELDNVKKSLQTITEKNGSLSSQPQVKYTQLAELNVDLQIKHLLENDQTSPLIAAGKLSIIGIIVDLHDVYGQGHGKNYLINYNGQTSADILDSDLFQDLPWRYQRLTNN